MFAAIGDINEGLLQQLHRSHFLHLGLNRAYCLANNWSALQEKYIPTAEDQLEASFRAGRQAGIFSCGLHSTHNHGFYLGNMMDRRVNVLSHGMMAIKTSNSKIAKFTGPILNRQLGDGFLGAKDSMFDMLFSSQCTGDFIILARDNDENCIWYIDRSPVKESRLTSIHGVSHLDGAYFSASPIAMSSVWKKSGTIEMKKNCILKIMADDIEVIT